MLDGGVRVVFVRSGSTSTGFCSNSDDYDRALNVLRVSSVEELVKREQRVYNDPELGAQREMSISSVPISGKRDGREEL